MEITYSIRSIGARIELWFGAIPAIKNIKEMQSKLDHGESGEKLFLGFHGEIAYSIRSIRTDRMPGIEITYSINSIQRSNYRID